MFFNLLALSASRLPGRHRHPLRPVRTFPQANSNMTSGGGISQPIIFTTFVYDLHKPVVSVRDNIDKVFKNVDDISFRSALTHLLGYDKSKELQKKVRFSRNFQRDFVTLAGYSKGCRYMTRHNVLLRIITNPDKSVHLKAQCLSTSCEIYVRYNFRPSLTLTGAEIQNVYNYIDKYARPYREQGIAKILA